MLIIHKNVHEVLRFCLGFPRQLNSGSLRETTGVQKVSLVVSVYLTVYIIISHL